MKIHLPLDLRLSSGDIFRSSIIFVVIIASLVFASVRAVAVDNEGGLSEKKIRISKFTEENNGKELPGAELAVYNGDYAEEEVPDSTKAIATWTTGPAKDLSLGEGTYTLVEKKLQRVTEKLRIQYSKSKTIKYFSKMVRIGVKSRSLFQKIQSH